MNSAFSKTKLLGLLLISVFSILILFWNSPYFSSSNFKKNSSSKHEHIFGILGGASVAIPKHLAQLVEYDSDPYFPSAAENQMQSSSNRSLRSFGFEINYPEFLLNNQIKISNQYESQMIASKYLVRASVISGENFGKNGSVGLQTRVDWYLNEKITKFKYVPMKRKTFGLFGYEPEIINTSKSEFSGVVDMRDKNIYVYRDEENDVKTLIECTNVNHENAHCVQTFLLLPEMKAKVRITYRKEHLSNWKNIQRDISEFIFSFRTYN